MKKGFLLTITLVAACMAPNFAHASFWRWVQANCKEKPRSNCERPVAVCPPPVHNRREVVVCERPVVYKPSHVVITRPIACEPEPVVCERPVAVCPPPVCEERRVVVVETPAQPEWMNTPTQVVVVNGREHYMHYYNNRWYNEADLPKVQTVYRTEYRQPRYEVSYYDSWGRRHR
jgi:hypothetical protein